MHPRVKLRVSRSQTNGIRLLRPKILVPRKRRLESFGRSKPLQYLFGLAAACSYPHHDEIFFFAAACQTDLFKTQRPHRLLTIQSLFGQIHRRDIVHHGLGGETRPSFAVKAPPPLGSLDRASSPP